MSMSSILFKHSVLLDNNIFDHFWEFCGPLQCVANLTTVHSVFWKDLIASSLEIDHHYTIRALSCRMSHEFMMFFLQSTVWMPHAVARTTPGHNKQLSNIVQKLFIFKNLIGFSSSFATDYVFLISYKPKCDEKLFIRITHFLKVS